jgi:L-2-hydroxyglutarate oxidase
VSVAAPGSSTVDRAAPSAGVFDAAVVGAGIVGLATAWRLRERNHGWRVAVLEKEARIAAHQTGNNSGVLHSGIYYKPGSLKALNCRRGLKMMVEFCREHGVPHEICGKVIVATEASELPLLERLHDRGLANGVNCRLIGPEQLREYEPNAAGLRAIRVEESGIVDYPEVCRVLARLIESGGGEVRTNARVREIVKEGSRVRVETASGTVWARRVVNCGGLHSDRVTRLSGVEPEARIVPFRGEYYILSDEAKGLVKDLIYPVPDPRFPFLGVHFTRMIGGEVECGPNAVLALAREGYRWRTVSPRDLLGTLATPGFGKFAARHWRMGAAEMWRSVSKAAFLRSLQRLVPAIRSEHIRRAGAGVRAQALLPTGDLLDDFSFVETGGVVNVCNAPSPAATASLSIGETVAEHVEASAG